MPESRKHILVVDDEALAASAVADFLTRKGYRATIAHGGNQALAIHGRDPADLVITDIRMPSGDGLSLIAALRKADWRLPVIVVTGQIEVDPRSPPKSLSGARVLKKPVSLRVLSDAITEEFARVASAGGEYGRKAQATRS